MLFTFPSRYSFAIGLSVVFSLSGWSPKIQPGFLVSRPTQVAAEARPGFAYGALTLSGPPFRTVPLALSGLCCRSYYPGTRRNAAGLGSSPFARRYWGNRSYFLFLPVLRCFSSRRSPHAISMMPESLPAGCPIRTPGGHSAFAARPRFSQLVTSFIASESPGIPHAPLSFRILSFPAPLLKGRRPGAIRNGSLYKSYLGLLV